MRFQNLFLKIPARSTIPESSCEQSKDVRLPALFWKLTHSKLRKVAPYLSHHLYFKDIFYSIVVLVVAAMRAAGVATVGGMAGVAGVAAVSGMVRDRLMGRTTRRQERMRITRKQVCYGKSSQQCCQLKRNINHNITQQVYTLSIWKAEFYTSCVPPFVTKPSASHLT